LNTSRPPYRIVTLFDSFQITLYWCVLGNVLRFQADSDNSSIPATKKRYPATPKHYPLNLKNAMQERESTGPAET
jgi:hypothetical protein